MYAPSFLRALPAWAALALAGAGILPAQDAPDVRWQPWLGCWEPSESAAARDSSGFLVCLTPVAGSAVEAVTVSGGEILARERIAVSANRQNSERDGCAGWEQAEWSPDGIRVYLTSEHMCSRDLVRRSSGLISITPDGEWLDVRSLAAGGRTGVRVVRYREVWPLPAGLPAEVAGALRERSFSTTAARLAAGSRLTPEQVVEASQRLEAAVVEAWLVERGQGFVLDARDLSDLAEAGVPASVTDLMVALSYPRRFGINRGTRLAEARPAERLTTEYDDVGPRTRRFSPFWDPFFYSPYDYDVWPYGYGYRRGWSPWGYGSYYDRPIIIVTDTPAEERPHGRVVRGRGYRSGNRSSDPPTTQTGSTGSSSSSSGNSSSTESSSSSSSSGGGSSERTAKPRGS